MKIKKSKKFVSMLLVTGLAICLGVPMAFATAENGNEKLAINDVMVEESASDLPFYDQLMAAESVDGMYELLLSDLNAGGEASAALSGGQIDALRSRVDELDPNAEYEYRNDLLDTLVLLSEDKNSEEDITTLATETISSNQNWQGGTTLTENATWTLHNGAVITFKEPVTIPEGKTLTLKGWGSIARYSTNTNALFVVKEGGKLIIEGTSTEKPFAIDGKNVIAKASLIVSSGNLDFKNAVIQNGKNRSVYPEGYASAGKPNGNGGGITIGTTGSLVMSNCVVTKNTASVNGGGIYCTGSMVIADSTISYNRAMSAETGDGVVNAGRGGGFHLNGDKATGVLTNVLVDNNAAMYYGGGGQVSNEATFTMENGTVFSNNKALLHGAGALHVTGDAVFTMKGGKMQGNTAQTVGGAIHSSYSCTLNLNKGEILGNVANGRGGGVHVNTGGAITLSEGIVISGNTANDQPTGSYAELDATGDNWSNVKCEGSHSNNGYGGGVLIDSGTCTVAGATITGNHAKVGGGGIALTMLNMSDGGLDDIMVAGFNMTSGVVSENTTDGNGAGVYLMSNKAKENIVKIYGEEGSEKYDKAIETIETENRHIKAGTYSNVDDILNGVPVASVSGGTVSDNVADANGGGLYLGDNTKFIISGGSITTNKAINGAGVYVASGTAEINGGSMSDNTASRNGGALYVDGDVAMTDGTVGKFGEAAGNSAVNGGGVYMDNGDFTMTAGSVTGNSAANGGGIYMNGGDFKMEHGAVNENSVTSNGGAVYMAGITSVLTMESGHMNGNKASDDGGAIYAAGGNLFIGLENCKGQIKDDAGTVTDENNDDHVAKGPDRHHPIIGGNEAADTGGGIAIAGEGVVRFYCGQAVENKALYKGVGMNVFMDGGEFYLYDGANVGVPRDPDLVIIGGELHNQCVEKEYLKLLYHKDNVGGEGNVFEGLAELNEYMNLPEGKYFWKAAEGFRFFGWTAQGYDSAQDSEYVRNKNQYAPSGTPVEIIDQEKNSLGEDQKTWDGTADKIMHLYALWAPEESDITFVDGLTNTVMADCTPIDYSIKEQAYVLEAFPAAKPGYRVVGWYIYQDEGQNANWGYEPIYKEGSEKSYANLNRAAMKDAGQYLKAESDGSLKLTVDAMTFGDITLIADYEPMFADLMITKGGCNSVDENQSFLFHVTGDPDDSALAYIDMTVSIQGNGSTTVKHLPVGKYTVTEVESWSWRYWNGESTFKSRSVVLDDPGTTKEASFSNVRPNIYWLDGDNFRKNEFNAVSA